MAGSTIDHLIAMTVFLGAMLIFISLFNQTIQTAVLYQRNRALATKCSDLLDNILLNPGYPLEYEGNRPVEWGKLGYSPTIFGLQDPEFSQYRLSPFSLMRLESSRGKQFLYEITSHYYSNVTVGFGSFLFVSSVETLNYSSVAKLLGINNTYGFQLTLTPVVDVSISEDNAGSPLVMSLKVTGNGIPFANATVSSMLIMVRTTGDFPSYHTLTNSSHTDNNGICTLSFQNVGVNESYAFIAYARFGGLVGVGYYQRIRAGSHAIPLVESISERRIVLAHSYDIYGFGASNVYFNATFMMLSQDFSLRLLTIEDSVGELSLGECANLTIPTFEAGILVVAYQDERSNAGVALMPWGVSSMAFPVVFGEDPLSKEWVATDIRQVIVGNVAYQAKLALWSLEGYGVMG
ncbi:MAG: hypothetical protein QXL91_03275 [Candidatus Bathyarchaeia archaeon]